jgi:hypothetical protein
MPTFYGEFPILLPGTTESVSRNGLKKITGTILFKPGQQDEARGLAEQSGALFPDPQVRTSDTGLLEMTFDAYEDTGRSSGVLGSEIINLSKSFETTVIQAVMNQDVGNNTPALIPYNWTITEIWVADSHVQFSVLLATLGSVFLNASPVTLQRRMLKRVITGKRPSGGASSLQITWASNVSSVTRRNFGSFDEVDIITSLDATIA